MGALHANLLQLCGRGLCLQQLFHACGKRRILADHHGLAGYRRLRRQAARLKAVAALFAHFWRRGCWWLRAGGTGCWCCSCGSAALWKSSHVALHGQAANRRSAEIGDEARRVEELSFGLSRPMGLVCWVDGGSAWLTCTKRRQLLRGRAVRRLELALCCSGIVALLGPLHGGVEWA